MYSYIKKTVIKLSIFSRKFSLSKKNNSSVFLGRKSKFQKNTTVSIGRKGTLLIGEKVKVRTGAILECYGRIEIKESSIIGPYNWLQGHGHIAIGKNTMIGPHCSIVSSNHKYTDPTKPIQNQGLENGYVHIGDNVWIGSHVVILNNVTIGNNVIIGAHSLVNRDIPENCIAFGIPAIKVRSLRNDNNEK